MTWCARSGFAAVLAAMWLGVALHVSAEEPAAELTQVDVFVGQTDDYFAYRIPALVTTTRGTLLAFCEGRKTSLADLGNNDLVMKRSTDGGRTWSPLKILHDDGDNTIGNPTAVVDSDTDTIWLVMMRNAKEVLISKSTDDGETWSEPLDITSQARRDEWKFYATGPGVGIQLEHGPHKGRLIIPAYHRTTETKAGPSTAHIFYSDDHGKSWQVGGSVGPHTNECQVVETLAEDRPGVMLNARNHWARSGGKPELSGKRIVFRSSDGGESWGKQELDEALVEPTCQASLLRYTWPEQNGRSRILFANPASKSRANMTVKLSYDEGKSWPVSRAVYPGSSAYSSLAVLPEGQIGLLYERDSYKKLTFALMSLAWLSEGKDKLGE